MTLNEMKKKILKLIEEYDKNNNTDFTNDPDIALKINDVINQIMFELARIKKIRARLSLSFCLAICARQELMRPR